jgi:hypothetical protein
VTRSRRPTRPTAGRPARASNRRPAPSPRQPGGPTPAAADLDQLVALGAQGRYHTAVRRLASWCDRAAADGPGSLDLLDAAVAAALARAHTSGGDGARLARLGSLASGQLRAVRHRSALHDLGPAWGGDGRHRGRCLGHPLPFDTPRRVLSRRRADVPLVVATAS